MAARKQLLSRPRRVLHSWERGDAPTGNGTEAPRPLNTESPYAAVTPRWARGPGNRSRVSRRYALARVRSGTHGSRRRKQPKRPSTDDDEYDAVHAHDGLLFSHEKERRSDTGSDVGEPQKHDTERKDPTQKAISLGIPIMRSIRNGQVQRDTKQIKADQQLPGARDGVKDDGGGE